MTFKRAAKIVKERIRINEEILEQSPNAPYYKALKDEIEAMKKVLAVAEGAIITKTFLRNL